LPETEQSNRLAEVMSHRKIDIDKMADMLFKIGGSSYTEQMQLMVPLNIRFAKNLVPLIGMPSIRDKVYNDLVKLTFESLTGYFEQTRSKIERADQLFGNT
jgi:hypothetical protein